MAMQRWEAGKSYDLVLVFDPRKTFDFVKGRGSGIYFNEQGAVMIPATLSCEETLMKAILTLPHGRFPIYDARYRYYNIGGMVSPQDSSQYPEDLQKAGLGPRAFALSADESADVGTRRLAEEGGWSGPVWQCPLCEGQNMAGVLLCLSCAAVVAFQAPNDQSLFSPIATLVAKIAAKAEDRDEDEIVKSIRPMDIARQVAFDGRVCGRSLRSMIRTRIKGTMSWQWKWLNSMWDTPQGFGELGQTPYMRGANKTAAWIHVIMAFVDMRVGQ